MMYFVAIAIFIVILGCYIFYRILCSLLTKILTCKASLAPKDNSDYHELNERRKQVQTSWLVHHEQTHVTCQSFDGLTLHANIIKQEEERHQWALIVHGYRGKSSDMVGASKQFYEHGFHTLRIDCRAHGQSEGNYIGMGWLDRLDVMRWIDVIVELDSKAEIVLYGVSMGGATVMMSTGEMLSKQVRCAIADCGYTSVYDIFYDQLKRFTKMPTKFILKAFDMVCKTKAKYSIYEASALSQLQKSHTPTLFIHGAKDDFVPCAMLKQNYEACAAIKEKLIFQEAGHGMSSLNEAYYNQVFTFIKRFM